MRDDTFLFPCSLGKVLTAIALMQQLEKGRFALDDDVGASLPFPLRNPRWPDVPITWRMLMTHTSSIQDDEAALELGYVYGRDHPLALGAYLEGIFKAGSPYAEGSFLESRPGTERVYSNIAVDVAGYALERLLEEPFAHYVTRAILQPLKIDASYSLEALPRDRIGVGYGRKRGPDSAWVYSPNRVSFAHLPGSPSILENMFAGPDPPAGTLYTSALQFAKVMMMLMNGGSLEGVKVLESGSVEALLTPSGFWSVYAYRQGLILYATRNLEDQEVWGHDGEDRGYIASMFFHREKRLGAVAFANANRDDFLLSRRLVDLDLHMMDWFDR